MDFIDQIFEFLPLPAALIVMGASHLISKQVTRDEKGRLPDWFLFIPFGIGFVLGVPKYFVDSWLEAVKGPIVIEPLWFKVVSSAFQGLLYGSVGVGLWSARKVIPFFKRVEANGSTDDSQSNGGTK